MSDSSHNDSADPMDEPRVDFSTRRHQMFPVLNEAEIARVSRFGTVHNYARGERLFEAGQPGKGMFVVLKGVVSINQRDGLGHVQHIVRGGPGEFLAEVGQLTGRPALVDGDLWRRANASLDGRPSARRGQRTDLATGAALLPVHSYYEPDVAVTDIGPALDVSSGDVGVITQALADRFAVNIAAHPADWHMLQPQWVSDLPDERRARIAGG